MSISHAPPDSHGPDISGISEFADPKSTDAESADIKSAEHALPELEPIVPASTRRTRVPAGCAAPPAPYCCSPCGKSSAVRAC